MTTTGVVSHVVELGLETTVATVCYGAGPNMLLLHLVLSEDLYFAHKASVGNMHDHFWNLSLVGTTPVKQGRDPMSSFKGDVREAAAVAPTSTDSKRLRESYTDFIASHDTRLISHNDLKSSAHFCNAGVFRYSDVSPYDALVSGSLES